ncbi:MAG: sensor histidine kinase [Polyangiales bacterium]
MSRFDGDDRGILAVLSLVVDTLPLRTAIVMDASGTEPRIMSWAAPGAIQEVERAKAHVQSTYVRLLGQIDPPPSSVDVDEATASSFLLLPLVDGEGRTFGALQLETVADVKGDDLSFAHVVADELGRAIARSGVGTCSPEPLALLAATQQFDGAIDGNTTRLAGVLATVASLCVIDMVEEDGSTSRTTAAPNVAAFVPRERIGGLVDRLVAAHARPLRGWWSSIDEDSPALSDSDRALIQELGLHSILHVPFVVDEGRRGRVVLLGGTDDPPFHSTLLRCVSELVRGGAIADENARLYRSALAGVRYRDELLTVVSHDLKNPLGAILMLTDSLLASQTDTPKKQLEAIRRAALRMSKLVTDLLDVASIGEQQLSVVAAAEDVSSMVSDAIDALRPLASSRGVSLNARNVDVGTVSADRLRVHQILGNLIGNALKFTSRGGSVEVRAERLERCTRFVVSDTGCGIAPAHLARVFDRFWQAPSARGGSGLGLYVVKSLVEAQGGTVSVRSELGVGTTFDFTLPHT